RDPEGIESTTPSADGLALLPVETALTAHKRTEAVRATTARGTVFGGYVIHAGRTSSVGTWSAERFARLDDGTVDGMCQERVIGTYLHGAFESAAVCNEIFGVSPPDQPKRATYDKLADWFDAHVRHIDRLGLPALKGTVA